MSGASSASDGEVSETQHKANKVNQYSESAINGSSRVFGLDGASDSHGTTLPIREAPSEY